MADLKLPKLPDRTPVKLTVVLSPQLYAALGRYLDLYRAVYGDETVTAAADLIPAMLESFLDSDRAFRSARRASSEKAGEGR